MMRQSVCGGAACGWQAPRTGTTRRPFPADVHLVPGAAQSGAEILVCTRSPEAFLMNTQGQVVKTLVSGKREGGEFLCSALTPRGKFVYCMGQDSVVYCFSAEVGGV